MRRIFIKTVLNSTVELSAGSMHGRSMNSTQNSGNLVLSMVKTPIQQQQHGDLSGQGEVEVIFTDFSW